MSARKCPFLVPFQKKSETRWQSAEVVQHPHSVDGSSPGVAMDANMGASSFEIDPPDQAEQEQKAARRPGERFRLSTFRLA